MALIAIVAVYSFPALAQDPEYHNFADKRSFCAIPNFFDVSSNLAFLAVGFMGLGFLIRDRCYENLFLEPSEKWAWLVFFGSIILTGAGSVYYHLSPDNNTLFWDRLPMATAFMSLFSIIITERIESKAGLYILPLLLIIGVGSVVYWRLTETAGSGDLRPYILVQFFSLLAIVLIFLLFPARYSNTKYLLQGLGYYTLAKAFEYWDKSIFDLLAETISGHTLKHLIAALGIYSIFKYLRERELITPTD